ncbi:hypothetical protein [Micromonospora sp. CPCC 206061]|uniref:hypothetical protein n=1 Tax=Micromonospora sp. CPCC 206061 TaxID=3122410 RepID=UPI002FF3CEC9
MALLLERSVEEAHLYMAMHPCDVCGESEFECRSAVIMAEGDLASRYEGECDGCGTAREFVFRLPETVSLPGQRLRFGGPEPSELLDAGEWLWVAGNFAAIEPLGDLAELTVEDLAAARADLGGAVAAMDEVLKFLPAGAEEPPDEAFWSEHGKRVRAERPGDLRRERLEARRAKYEEALALLP